MNITYERIFSVLKSKFTFISSKEKNYFLDDLKRIVATVDENVITMFYDYPECSSEIWNHKGKVAIAFCKNFNVNGHICDVFCISGLCGATNDYKMHKNFYIDKTYNDEMEWVFRRLNNIDKLILNSDEYIGRCGYLSSSNGIANFDICRIIKIDDLIVNKDSDREDINIVNLKGYQTIDYQEVYDFYRQKNDWYYNIGYSNVGSPKIRDFTERRKNSTADVDAIHLPKNISILDTIYQKENQSLNAKRLQMISFLNSLLNDKKAAINYISSRYNFSIRNCDLKRKRVK